MFSQFLYQCQKYNVFDDDSGTDNAKNYKEKLHLFFQSYQLTMRSMKLITELTLLTVFVKRFYL